MKRRSPRRAFGFVRVRPGRPRPYLAGYNPPQGGQEMSRAFATEAEAELWLAEQHVAAKRQGYIAVDAHHVTVADYWARYLADARKRCKPNSAEKYEIAGRVHILPTFGSRTLVALRRHEVQSWVNGLELAPRTAATMLSIFSGMLNQAIADELLMRSPAFKVTPPHAPRRQLHIPKPEEIAAIAEAMYRPLRLMVVLATEAGLRQGEVLGLRTGAVDLDGGYLDVVGQAQSVTGLGVLLDQSTKSPAGYRRIPLEEATVEAIEKHLAEYAHRSGLVFTTLTGRPVRRGMAYEHWMEACRRAGMDRLRFHDLRHRYASGLIAHDVDPKRVQYLMGHNSITETMDTYGHLWHNGDDKVRDAIRRMRGTGQ